MLYSKPSRIEKPRLPENIAKWEKAEGDYTKMAIFFDENFYDNKHRSDEICYKYMYLIFYMLVCKKRYFHRFEDYDGFAQFASNTIYMRFLKKWSHGERIRSVLNYSKKVLYPLKVMYQNAEFRDVTELGQDEETLMRESMRENVQSQYYEGLEEAIIDEFKEIPNIIREEVNKTHFKTSAVESKRIYTSCLITLLKSFTLSNYNKGRLEKRGDSISEESIIKMFNKERENCVTLWRLDESMSNYILVLTNKIRQRIKENIGSTKHSFELDESTLDTILMTAWETSSHEETDQESDN